MNSPPLWKENRVCAVSLVYVEPYPAVLAWVLRHHFAVGIRGTLVSTGPAPAELEGRNWDLRGQLPPDLIAAPATAGEMLERIESTVPAAGWTVWLFGRDELEALGGEGHRSLLSRLGDQHARIWCAPFRDVADYDARCRRA